MVWLVLACQPDGTGNAEMARNHKVRECVL
jgi:hypothetical protein